MCMGYGAWIALICAVFSNMFVNIQLAPIVCVGLKEISTFARNSRKLVNLQASSIVCVGAKEISAIARWL